MSTLAAQAGKPQQVARTAATKRGWKAILLGTCQGISDDRVLAVAAGVAFYGLLAMFPAVAAVVSLYGLFAQTVGVGVTFEPEQRTRIKEYVVKERVAPVTINERSSSHQRLSL